MNETLKVKIEGDIKSLERELNQADKLLQQHERNYKRIQNTVSQNTQKSRDLQSSLQRLNAEFDKGQISESRYAKETDRLSNELREVNGETKSYQKELKRLDTEMDRLTASTKQYQGAASNTAGASNQAAGAVTNLGNATRVNALPAMTSFSQVVQDAPYGIRGVANNIQQLTMQMGYLSKGAGGTMGALKAMGASLMGPAGILLGVSLVTSALIQYGDKLSFAKDETDKLREETEKAREELDKFVESLNNLDKVKISASVEADKEIALLKQLESQMAKVGGKDDEKQAALKRLRELYPGILKNYKDEILLSEGLGKAYDEIKEKIDRRVGSEEAQKQINKNLELRGKLIKKEDSLTDQLNTNLERQTDLKEKIDKSGGALLYVNELAKAEEKALDLTKQREAVLKDINTVNKENVNLTRDVTIVAEDIELDTSKAKSGEAVRIPVKTVLEMDSSEGNSGLQSQMAWVKMLEAQIAQMEIAQTKFPVYSEAYRSLGEQIDFAKGRLSGFNATLHENAQAATDAFAKRNEETAVLNQEFLADQLMLAAHISQAFGTLATQITDSMLEGKLSVEDFAKSIFKALAGLMIKMGQQAIAEKIMAKASIATDAGVAQGNAGVIATNAAAAAGPAGVALLPGLLAAMSGLVGSFFGGISAFATGGVVGGHSYTGDKILTRLNSGELVLNQTQQRSLMGAMNAPSNMGGQTATSLDITGAIEADGDILRVIFERAQQRNSRYN